MNKKNYISLANKAAATQIKELSKIKFKEKFDLITCWDYLDHILNPKETFKNLSKQVNYQNFFQIPIFHLDQYILKTRYLHQ